MLIWVEILFTCGHRYLFSLSAALLYHRLLLRSMVKAWWSLWYPYLCGYWRAWPAAKHSWETGRKRLRGRKLNEKSCLSDIMQRKHWGKKVKRWVMILWRCAIAGFIVKAGISLFKSFSFLKRYLELDDQIEQERRAMRGREKERERRERDLEKKARQQADQCAYLNIYQQQ